MKFTHYWISFNYQVTEQSIKAPGPRVFKQIKDWDLTLWPMGKIKNCEPTYDVLVIT